MLEGKKLMVLGGSFFQLPIILEAKKLGLYVISCDYLPDNPGHEFSDEYYNVSTTDKEAVLSLARDLDIDAIITFSSDPAITTVAYVASKLGLYGPSPDAIITLSEKDRFRSLLSDLGLNVPDNYVVNSPVIPEDLKNSDSKFVIKPVDSCGSKGITLAYPDEQKILESIQYALDHSRIKKCILEEYIEGEQIHGDGYMQNGKLIYHFLGDQYFYTKTNSFIPISTQWPCKHIGSRLLDSIMQQVETICISCGYLNGPLNIEARITCEDKIYIIEVSPRNGGNFVPLIQKYLTGFDFMNAIIRNAFGFNMDTTNMELHEKPGAYYVLHSEEGGFYQNVAFSNEIMNNIVFYEIFKNKGDAVNRYTGSNTTIGVAIMEFDSINERNRLMSDIKKHIKLEISENNYLIAQEAENPVLYEAENLA